MKKWIPALLAVCAPLSACGQDDGGKAVIDVTKSVKAYETMSYLWMNQREKRLDRIVLRGWK